MFPNVLHLRLGDLDGAIASKSLLAPVTRQSNPIRLVGTHISLPHSDHGVALPAGNASSDGAVSAPLARRAAVVRAERAVGSNDVSPRAVGSCKSDVAPPCESAPRAVASVDCGNLASASHASPRGRIVSAVAGALVAIHLAAAASPLEAVAAAFNAAHPWVAAAEQSPYVRAQEGQDEDVGLLDGRIRPCPLAVNPNCVSTSSLSLAYSPPWTVPSLSSATAVQRLEGVLRSALKNPVIEDSVDVADGGHYIRAKTDGLFGRDTVELLLRDDNVLYRSIAGRVVYIYPFTTPLTDFDAQRKRMDALGKELGWLQEYEYETEFEMDYDY
ncbi:unnamed protein product [Closterium sp. Yama58-4]|nr:unnamed protein product [Closterium sp. Yama58-4]